MIELLMKSRKLINAQDDTRSDLQRLETLHGDESEAFRRLHAAVPS